MRYLYPYNFSLTGKQLVLVLGLSGEPEPTSCITGAVLNY